MAVDIPPRLKGHPYVAAFLQAIAGAPNDPAPALIFADWLEEHDEPVIATALRLEWMQKAAKPEPPKPEPPVRRVNMRRVRRAVGETLKAIWIVILVVLFLPCCLCVVFLYVYVPLYLLHLLSH